MNNITAVLVLDLGLLNEVVCMRGLISFWGKKSIKSSCL